MSHDPPQRPMTDDVWHRAELLDKLIEHLGISGIAARLDGGDALLGAHANCLDCTVRSDCERLLSDTDPFGTANACPNLTFLKRCLALKQARLRPTHTP